MMQQPLPEGTGQVSDLRLLLSVEEAARLLCLGRNTFYELMLSGQIASIKVGRLRRVPVAALHDFVQQRMVACRG
jgi:excisionase family DNA binding protein